MGHLLPVYARSDFTFTKGEGSYLFDEQGKRYVDFAAGIAVNSLGHSHPDLVKALKDQAEKLWHVSNMYHIEGAEELAEKITKASGFAEYIFFCNSGAEAVECGIKMAKKYFYEQGKPEKNRIITFEGAFHGRTMATISAANKEKLTKGFSPLLDGFDQASFNDLEAVKNTISDKTAAVLIEPIQGEGGIRPCSVEFLQGLRKICDDNGLLLFFDGVQCGMGRTGKLFSHEWANIKADIVSSAKGIGSGFPLGACLCTKEVGDAMTPGSHGSTYAGGPLAIAVCKAVMDIMLADGFLDDVVKKGEYFRQKIDKISQKYPGSIKEIRGKGLMIGIKLDEEKIADSKSFVDELRHKGLLTAAAADNVVRILPPLNIKEEVIDEGLKILEEHIGKKI